MSTLFVNNLNTASGSTITIPTGKTLKATDTPIVGAGNIIQVVQGTALGSATSSSTSFVTSGIDVDITPKYASSKILIQATTCCDNEAAGRQMYLTLYRDSTRLDSTYVSGSYGLGSFWNGGERTIGNVSIHILDTPNSTSQLHYELYYRSVPGTQVETNTQTVAGVIMCMEIAQEGIGHGINIKSKYNSTYWWYISSIN